MCDGETTRASHMTTHKIIRESCDFFLMVTLQHMLFGSFYDLCFGRARRARADDVRFFSSDTQQNIHYSLNNVFMYFFKFAVY